MDYSQFLYMKEEVSLIVVMAILFLYDLIASEKARKYFSVVACVLLGAHIIYNLIPTSTPGSAFGGMYYYTPMMTIIKSILTFGTLIVFMQADLWLKREDTKFKQGEFYFLILSTLLGMFFMIASGHFLMFFLGLEMASIPMSTLIAFDKYRHNSAEAGAKYILTAMFSSALLLFGLSFLYGACGTLYFEDIPALLTSGNYMQLAAFVFFIAGIGFKISIVPFHLWTADVYQGAPTPVTSYLSVISKGSAVFVLLTILMKVFAPMVTEWQNIIYGLIVITITIGNLFALRQKNMKRFLAFSSISQAGYILLGVIGGTAIGMASLVYYVLVYMVANLAIFGVISIIEQRTEKVSMDDYNGLYKTNPKLTFLTTLALFSLAGIPPFAGFFSKFFVFMAAFKSGFIVLVVIALLNTIISLYYYLLVVKAMYINKNDNPIEPIKTDCYTKISLTICLIGIIGLGITSIVYETITAFSYGM
ncbi:MAG TPA: NADH-quinone oxidoreductase subunit N [Bacteroidales bacterium]|nr:NADH-quinone oxidoreductase subunit N [Bacteroidales bacterium]